MFKPIFISLTFGFLIYGIIGMFLGLGGGFPDPCDNNVKATIVSCTPSETIGEFTYTITYVDVQHFVHFGDFTSKINCPLQKVTQYVDICYGSYAPDDFKMHQPIVFSDYRTPIALFTTGIISIVLFIILFFIMCKADSPPKNHRIVQISELSNTV